MAFKEAMGKPMWTKVEEILDARGHNWSWLATLIGVHHSRLSKWRGGTGEPDRLQLLAMSRALGVGMEYLADDLIEAPAPAPTPDEDRLLWAVRSLGIDAAEALRRIEAAGRMAGRGAPNPGTPPRGLEVRMTLPEGEGSGPRRRKAR